MTRTWYHLAPPASKPCRRGGGWPRQRLRSERLHAYLRIWQRTLAPETKWCRRRLGVKTTRGWNICGSAPLNTIGEGRPSTPAWPRTAPQHLPWTRLTKGLGGASLASSPTQRLPPRRQRRSESRPTTKTAKDEGRKRAKKKAAEAAKKSWLSTPGPLRTRVGHPPSARLAGHRTQRIRSPAQTTGPKGAVQTARQYGQ